MKKLMIPIMAVIAACSLTACFGDKDGDKKDDDIKVTYHFNGGYRGGDPNATDDYTARSPVYNLHQYKTISAKKDTWYLEGWYFDEELTEKFSDDRLAELYDAKAQIDLYANWIDRVTVTQSNFKDFFKVSSSWNGGLNTINAAINYSFTPIMAYDPDLSTQEIEISVTPHLGTWSSDPYVISLKSDADYYYSGQKRVTSGAQFQVGSSTFDWSLVTESFELQLLHRDPIAINLELDGAECEKTSFDVEGGHKLLKSELPTPQKGGYRFMGWYSDAEYKTEYEERMITRERTLYAKFLKEVKVTYHSNGGTEYDDLHLLSGDFIKTYQPQREGYKFMDWYTDADFANRLALGAKAEEADVELYAKWAKIHTLSFETNGGSAVEALSVADGETPHFYAVSTSKSGLTFVGWYTDPECQNKYVEGPLNSDLTLYALWAREISFSYPTIEDLEEYLDIVVTEEYTTVKEGSYNYNVRLFTITASIKEEYSRLGFYINGSIEIKFTGPNNQDYGNLYVQKFTLDAESGKLQYEGEYYVKRGIAGYEETTTWKLNPHISYGYVYLPEDSEVE
ncbi:MAG: InlB B-repeat-containing protein [Clostridiales bacterium]|nr:InlB B-repeat-containing protein [Clostridiales bacterium]